MLNDNTDCDIEITMELEADYEVTRKFWPRKKYEWKVFWRNPWRYWRSYVLKEQIVKRFADQIRKDIDARVLDDLQKQPVLRPGDLVKLPFQGEMIFAGIWYLAKCREVHSRNPNWDYWNRRNDREPQYFADMILSRDTEPYYLFHTPRTDSAVYEKPEFHARRKPKTFEFISGGNVFKPVLPNEIYKFNGSDYFYGMGFGSTKEVTALDIEKIKWPRESYYESYPVRHVRVEK